MAAAVSGIQRLVPHRTYAPERAAQLGRTFGVRVHPAPARRPHIDHATRSSCPCKGRFHVGARNIRDRLSPRRVHRSLHRLECR
ncbi:hypothetical protein FHX42_000431 [Saccharopolyspora lacisalsi]|uniref:Uncharacterized protein n=1 Tax=Halosaccharopolyspora lacisalsi TaxID=1000566 RepID=A0A839DMB1_9PSEU|nr:hypothetical protein [Halosaccharopolyspora lacisalsi]